MRREAGARLMEVETSDGQTSDIRLLLGVRRLISLLSAFREPWTVDRAWMALVVMRCDGR